MRKHAKFAIALAAVTLAASTGALVACDKHNPNAGNGDTDIYTVTFHATSDTGAGTVTPTSAKTGADGKLTLDDLPVPTSTEDLKFIGWYVNADGSGSKVTINKVYDEDTDLYAKWSGEQGGEVEGVFTITFHANGGEFDDDVTTLTRETANGKLSGFVANPYLTDEDDDRIFGGWYLNEDGTGEAVTLEHEYDEDTDLYANWVSDEIGQTEYAITFDANGGTIDGLSEEVVQTVDGKLPMLLEPDEREDYTFDGWFTESGDEVTTDTEFDAASIVVAHWTKIQQVTVAPYYLYGTVGGVDKNTPQTGYAFAKGTADNETISEQYVATAKLSAGDTVKVYASAVDGGGDYNHYEDGCLGENCSYNEKTGYLDILQTGTFTFYFKLYKDGGDSVWVNYDAPIVIPDVRPVAKISGKEMTDNTDHIEREDATGAPINQTQILEYIIDGVELGEGDTIAITVDGVTKKVYVDSASTGINVTVTDALVTPKTTVSGVFSFTLKKWQGDDNNWGLYARKTGELPEQEVGEKTITFNANGGSVTTTTATTGNNGRLSSLPTPTPPDGKKFDGWFTALEGGDQVTTAYVFLENKTIYALYSDIVIDEDNCIMVNGVAFEQLGSIPNADYDAQYGLTGVSLNKDDVIKFNIDVEGIQGTTGGKPVTFVVDQYSKGIIVDGIYSTSKLYTEVTIAVDGTFDFYVKHSAGDKNKWQLYAETSAAGAEKVTGTETLPTGIVEVDTSDADAGYMVGNLDGNSEFDGDHGYLMNSETNQFSITKHLDAGAVIKFRNGTGDFWTAAIQSGSPAAANFKIIKIDNQDNIEVLNSGTYTFYVKTMANSDHPGQIYVTGTADPSGEIGEVITVTLTFSDATVTIKHEKDGAKKSYIWIWAGKTNLCTAGWPGDELADRDLSSYSVTEVGFIISHGGDDSKTADITLDGTKSSYTIIVYKDGGYVKE